jgi:hypothetical protein
MNRFWAWFLRTDIDYDASYYRIGSPMFWRAIQTIAVISLVVLALGHILPYYFGGV